MEGSIGIIRNPTSGRGSGAKRWPKIEGALREVLGGRVERIEETTAAGSARDQAARMASDGIDIVAAAGGDGTVSQVMQGLLGTESALAVIPLGTGNDFARTIGVGPNPNLAISALANDRRVWSDIGKWKQGSVIGHFLNIAGCGFDAAVAHRINSGIRNLRGRAAYLAAILLTLRSYRPANLELEIDGTTLNRKVMLCAIANAKSYGGGMKVAPNAHITDGFLDLVLVEDISRMSFLINFPKVLKGTHLSHPRVSQHKFRELRLVAEADTRLLVDGELLPPGPLSISVVPSAVEVVVGSNFGD
jgi:diacylglycerol kinase (ATP)